MRRLGYAALLFYFFGTAAVADQVTLKNGDRLTGTIVKTDDKVESLLVKTEFAADVVVGRDYFHCFLAAAASHAEGWTDFRWHGDDEIVLGESLDSKLTSRMSVGQNFSITRDLAAPAAIATASIPTSLPN